MFQALDPLLHAQLRLAIMSALMSVEKAKFSYLLEKTSASKGNLSTQITKLKQAGYIEVEQHFQDNKPEITCWVTQQGVATFDEYYQALRSYFPEKSSNRMGD